jgi:hypothetical protein
LVGIANFHPKLPKYWFAPLGLHFAMSLWRIIFAYNLMSTAHGEFILGQYRIGDQIFTQGTPSAREPSAKSASESTSQQVKRWQWKPFKNKR